MSTQPVLSTHAADSPFHGWASSVVKPAEEKGITMQLSPKYREALLGLPRFKNVDIVDLYRMANEKLTYGKASGLRSGTIVSGVKILGRAFAIAILVGYKKLDDPLFQIPLVASNASVMPQFAQ